MPSENCHTQPRPPISGDTLLGSRYDGKLGSNVYSTPVSSNGVSGLTAMTHHYTTGGNSGGPWFLGTGGYGVHRGWTSIWFAERAVFTPLNRVMPAFGAFILVN